MKILFPLTNRVHFSRNQLLLNELKKHFKVHLATYGEKDLSMSEIAVDITSKFQKALDTIKPDLVLIRADRFELLPCAMLSVYGGYKVAQLEAGDLSGVVDNKVRFAISHLSDYHFTTNDDSQKRMLDIGFKNVWNCGSLDCEYALQCPKTPPGRMKPYIMALYHPIPEEDATEVFKALEQFPDYDIIGIKSNNDYAKSAYKEEYSPEEFINLLRGASCIVGNSSCLIKEASILGTPAVLVGSRQANRLRTKNIIDTKCVKQDIQQAIEKQLKSVHQIDLTYYKPDSSKKICEKLKLCILDE